MAKKIVQHGTLRRGGVMSPSVALRTHKQYSIARTNYSLGAHRKAALLFKCFRGPGPGPRTPRGRRQGWAGGLQQQFQPALLLCLTAECAEGERASRPLCALL